jgi:hypothetical protein
MRLIRFTQQVEVPDEESDKSLDQTLSELEDYLAKNNYDIYDTDWEEE